MPTFEFKEPKLNKDKANKKWFVRYGIKYPGDEDFNDLKEYGRCYFDKSLNSIKDLKARQVAFNDLLYLVKTDLKAGVDKKNPASAQVYIEKQVKQQLKYTFDYCLDFYLKQKGYINPIPKKEQSAQTVSMFLKNQFRPFLETNGLMQDVRLIKKSHLLDFVNHFYLHSDPDLKWSNNTYNNKRSYLGSFFSLLLDEEIVESNPVLLIKRKPKQKTQRFGVFTRQERDLLFDYLDKHHTTVSVMAKTVYYSYIRISEITRLKVEDFNILTQRIRVEADNAKTQTDQMDRYVGMRKPLQEALIEYLNQYEHQPKWFMFGQDKKPSIYRIGKGWQIQFTDAVKALRVENPKLFNRPGLTPYSMKHTGVTHFIEDNIKTSSTTELLQFVQQQCRHADFSETQIYWKQLGFEIDVISPFLNS